MNAIDISWLFLCILAIALGIQIAAASLKQRDWLYLTAGLACAVIFTLAGYSWLR